MKPWAEIDAVIDDAPAAMAPEDRAAALLAAGEAVLEQWLAAHGITPGATSREGFRLLALHHQGARQDPSFNACRETCRELAYHYNQVQAAASAADAGRWLTMMRFVARHLSLFVSGKLEERALGDFCCSAKPLRQGTP